MQTIIYRIKGPPIAIVKNQRGQRKCMDYFNRNLLDYQRQLANQHNDNPLLTGAWALDIHFLFEKSLQNHKEHTQSPTITQLMRFVDEVTRGIIFDNECIINDIRAHKDYSQAFPETTLIFNRK